MGAGIAGLVAADALSRHGATVLLHEARDRVGGRLHSAATPGGAIDLGATWFWPDEPLVHALADQLGLATFAQHVHGDALFEAGGGGPRRLDGNPIDTPSARFTDGAQGLARALASRLPSGTLRLGEPVLALTAADDGIRVDAGARSVHAKDVILAVPPALVVEGIRFAPPLPADVRRAASSTAVWMGGVTKAVAVYAEAFWRAQGALRLGDQLPRAVPGTPRPQRARSDTGRALRLRPLSSARRADSRRHRRRLPRAARAPAGARSRRRPSHARPRLER